MGAELLRLIIFTTCAFTLNFSNFINFLLGYLCIKISLKSQNVTNIFDPIIMFSNILNLFIHLVTFQINYYINQLNKTKIGSIFFSVYNLANNKLVQIQNYIFYEFLIKPIKFLFQDYLNPFLINSSNYQIQKDNSNIQPINLSNDKEVNDFLDKILADSKYKTH